MMNRYFDPHGHFQLDLPAGWRVRTEAEQRAATAALPRHRSGALPTQIVHEEHGCISISCYVDAMWATEPVGRASWDEASHHATPTGRSAMWCVSRGGVWLAISFFGPEHLDDDGERDARAIVESITPTPQTLRRAAY